VINFSFKLCFQEYENKCFEQTDQFFDERRETEKDPLQEISQEIPNNSQITQQSPLKFRLKKSSNPKCLNSYPQLALQGNIYYFSHKLKNPESLFYRCKNQKHCKAYIYVSFDKKVVNNTVHSCNGYIDNATIVSVFSKNKFYLFFIYFL